jgi:hypothetical protein
LELCSARDVTTYHYSSSKIGSGSQGATCVMRGFQKENMADGHKRTRSGVPSYLVVFIDMNSLNDIDFASLKRRHGVLSSCAYVLFKKHSRRATFRYQLSKRQAKHLNRIRPIKAFSEDRYLLQPHGALFRSSTNRPVLYWA